MNRARRAPGTLWLLIPPLLLLCLLLIPQQTYAAPTKDYYADHFDTNITIQTNGSLLIKETEVFHFIGGPFHEVDRELPTDNTDGITVQQASIDGEPLSQGSNANQYDVTGSNPETVIWHLSGISDATRSFEVTYLVRGAIQRSGQYDSLHWIVLPTQHSYTIRSATITIHYPANTQLINASQEENATLTRGAQTVTYTKQDINADETLHVLLDFPHGSLISKIPDWQQQQIDAAQQQLQAEQRASMLALPMGLGALLLAILGIVAALFIKNNVQPTAAYKQLMHRSMLGRNKHIPASDDQRIANPPGKLSPAFAGALLDSSQLINNASQIQISINQALATLFDFANRGILTIKEQHIGSYGTIRPRSEFNLELEAIPGDLQPYEEGLLTLLFASTPQAATSVAFTAFARQYATRSAKFAAPLENEIRKAGLIDATGTLLRARLKAFGQLMMIIGGVGAFLCLTIGGSNGYWPLFMPFVALLLVGIITFNRRKHCYALTVEGERLAVQWQGYYAYLYDIAHNRTSDTQEQSSDFFVRNFPYAASFGLGQTWIDHFEKLGITTLPPWFLGMAGPQPAGSVSNGYYSPLSTMFMYSRPPYGVYYYPNTTSTSGFGGGSSGNFGGGGFSGGGGFGGGGGSGAS